MNRTMAAVGLDTDRGEYRVALGGNAQAANLSLIPPWRGRVKAFEHLKSTPKPRYNPAPPYNEVNENDRRISAPN